MKYVRYAIAVLLVAVGCSVDEPIPTGSIDGSRSLSAAFVPPGECPSYHTINHAGGAEDGGTTIFQSDCNSEYTAWFQSGGDYYYYNGSFFSGQASGENFCTNFPSVYSCVHPPIEWCELDPECDGEHPYHEQSYPYYE
jgi:hypothetical protein